MKPQKLPSISSSATARKHPNQQPSLANPRSQFISQSLLKTWSTIQVHNTITERRMGASSAQLVRAKLWLRFSALAIEKTQEIQPLSQERNQHRSHRSQHKHHLHRNSRAKAWAFSTYAQIREISTIITRLKTEISSPKLWRPLLSRQKQPKRENRPDQWLLQFR